ncbi:relaxase/mobilization nuclease domain-containing protein [Empedobacter falsenii]|uniref:relaxase/mobilization nuclease domain-containing protein n=1 Tax=Algoriella xinjiangensis TaxID=684065 RepID=UPI000F634AC5|nr:relaxase/mobilization nuclease domain-containing protein [Algoriella xinjiangensis]VDH16679.1 Relaxase/Mobilisation nuclease domain [Algoriella xinjiangensis]
MIVKVRSVRGSAKSIDYIQNDKGFSMEIDRNGLFGETGIEIHKEFREVQKLNERCKNNTINMVISPPKEYTKDFKHEDWQKLGTDYLQKFKLDENQFISCLHQSRNNDHLHIIANRIDYNGKAIDANYIGLQGQKLANEISKERGWKTAKDFSKEQLKCGKDEAKSVLKSELMNSKNTSIDKLKESLKEKGFELNIHSNKQGKEVGARLISAKELNQKEIKSDSKLINQNNEKNKGFKLSELGKEFRMETIHKQLEQNNELEKSRGYGKSR